MTEQEPLIGVLNGDEFNSLMECLLTEKGYRVASESLIKVSVEPQRRVDFFAQRPKVLLVNINLPVEYYLNLVNTVLSDLIDPPEVIYTSCSKKIVDDALGCSITLSQPFDNDELSDAVKIALEKASAKRLRENHS